MPQVVLDGLRAEEERGRRLPRGLAVREQQRDLQLAGGQVDDRPGLAPPQGQSGGVQLRQRDVGPAPGAEPLEVVQGRAQVLPPLANFTE